MSPEAWLRGPVEGVPPLLMPAAHALVQAREDVTTAVRGLTPDQLWARPGGAASIGYHLQHLAGSLGRLCAYAQGRALSPAEIAAIKHEGVPGQPLATGEDLVATVDGAVESALAVLRATREDHLLDAREVGRARLPSTVLGLLFHAAEHTQRHVGQVITTAKVVASGGM